MTAADSRGALYWWNGNDFERMPWRTLVKEASDSTRGLRNAGVRQGSRVAAVLVNDVGSARTVLATWLAGGTLASLPMPSRGQAPAEYGAQLLRIVTSLDAAVLVVPDNMADMVPEEVAAVVAVRTSSSLAGTGHVEAQPPGPDDLAFIQYSSGSTGTPKGCALSTRAIENQMAMILSLTGGRGRHQETYASWLPLSHDMGFFGCFLQPWVCDFDLALSTPQRFMFTPRTWFRDMSEFQATVTAAPNTSLYLATRAQRQEDLPQPLALRCAVIGAERVDWGALQAVRSTFAPHGLAPTALTPAYGMAEATLAVTACPWDQEPKSMAVDPVELAEGKVVEMEHGDPRATRVVSTGPPVTGAEVRAGDGTRVEEIEISSASLGAGYYGDLERTSSRFVSGGFQTGDVGFLRDGELYVVGRTDDMVQIAGRSVYANELEAAVANFAEIRNGCTVVLNAPTATGDELVLLAELRKQRKGDLRELAGRAARMALRTMGIDIGLCVFLSRGALPHTPSGKIQRFRAKQLFVTGALEPLGTVRTSG